MYDKKGLIVKANQSLAKQTFRETQNPEGEYKREVINVYNKPKTSIKQPKKDHLAEMKRGVIYFGISLLIMSAFVVFVVRPWEQSLVDKAYKEYAELLQQSKELTKDYNEVMYLLRESYKQK
ncbi:MAG: hypothetical protein HWN81_00545 [Candidatus Lokiarchaeota archaeon]|nr:hypothetical protein [Candidatus Lokiarchaeota archaeon]